MVTSPPGRPPGTSTSRGTIFPTNNHTDNNTNNSSGSNNTAYGDTNNNNNTTAHEDIFQKFGVDIASFRKLHLTTTENNTINTTDGNISDHTKDILQQIDARFDSFSKLLLHLTATLRTTSPRPARTSTSTIPSTVSSTVSPTVSSTNASVAFKAIPRMTPLPTTTTTPTTAPPTCFVVDLTSRPRSRFSQRSETRRPTRTARTTSKIPSTVSSTSEPVAFKAIARPPPAALQIHFHDNLVYDAYSKKKKTKKTTSRTAQPANLPRARLARRKTSKTNTPPMAPARNSLKPEQQLTPDHEDNLVYDAYCKKKKNRRPCAKSNRKLSPRLEAQ